MADMKDTKQRNQSSDEAAAQSSLKRIMSPSAEPTRAIVQGRTIELPPTSTHPGNKERSLFVSDRYFTHTNVKT